MIQTTRLTTDYFNTPKTTNSVEDTKITIKPGILTSETASTEPTTSEQTKESKTTIGLTTPEITTQNNTTPEIITRNTTTAKITCTQDFYYIESANICGNKN